MKLGGGPAGIMLTFLFKALCGSLSHRSRGGPTADSSRACRWNLLLQRLDVFACPQEDDIGLARPLNASTLRCPQTRLPASCEYCAFPPAELHGRGSSISRVGGVARLARSARRAASNDTSPNKPISTPPPASCPLPTSFLPFMTRAHQTTATVDPGSFSTALDIIR